MVNKYWIHPLNLVTDKELDEVAKTGNEYRDSMKTVIKLSELKKEIENLEQIPCIFENLCNDSCKEEYEKWKGGLVIND